MAEAPDFAIFASIIDFAEPQSPTCHRCSQAPAVFGIRGCARVLSLCANCKTQLANNIAAEIVRCEHSGKCWEDICVEAYISALAVMRDDLQLAHSPAAGSA